MESIIFLIEAYHPILFGYILLFVNELTVIHLELLIIFFILLFIVILQVRIIYLKKTEIERTEYKSYLNAEQSKQNAVLQIKAK